jgi:cell division protease FtsH
VPRGRAALGYTMQRPVEEQMLLTQAELEDRLTVLLGGRCAEELVFGDVSTGAADDLDRATSIARQMATMFGMGEAAGLMRCVHDPDSPFLAGAGARLQRDCSEATAQRIDDEVRQVLASARERASALLGKHRRELEQIAEALLQRERLDRDEFEALLGPRTGGRPAAPSLR